MLRTYQQQIVDDVRSEFRAGRRKVTVQLATGGGKTMLGSFMVQGSSQRGLTCWWLTHRRELATQASRTFTGMGIEHGLIAGGHATDITQRVQIASIQTIARRIDKMPTPSLIVFDECHHMGAAQWQAIFNAFPNAYILGLSATPWRLDGVGLGRWFEAMVQGPTVGDLIDDGHLSRYRLFAPSTADLGAVKTTAGDYQRDQLAAVMDKPSITGDAVQHYRQLCPNKRAVAFAVSIEHSQHIAAQFNAAGIPAEHVDGQMRHEERDAAVARFVAGQTLVLSNADLLGEGFDVPAIEAAILLRPTQSLSLHLQQIGRALRPAPGKEHAIILDHAGNALRHGLPDDDREWTLDDRQKRKKSSQKSEVPVKQCPKCYRVHAPAATCPQCGHTYAVVAREIEQRDGKLEEIDPFLIRQVRKSEERDCRTIDDFIRLAQQRGYKYPLGWAKHRFHARQGRRAA